MKNERLFYWFLIILSVVGLPEEFTRVKENILSARIGFKEKISSEMLIKVLNGTEHT